MGQATGFVIAIALILAGILFNRQDSKEIRNEIRDLREMMYREFKEFYKTLGQHDARLDNLEKKGK